MKQLYFAAALIVAVSLIFGCDREEQKTITDPINRLPEFLGQSADDVTVAFAEWGYGIYTIYDDGAKLNGYASSKSEIVAAEVNAEQRVSSIATLQKLEPKVASDITQPIYNYDNSVKNNYSAIFSKATMVAYVDGAEAVLEFASLDELLAQIRKMQTDNVLDIAVDYSAVVFGQPLQLEVVYTELSVQWSANTQVENYFLGLRMLK